MKITKTVSTAQELGDLLRSVDFDKYKEFASAVFSSEDANDSSGSMESRDNIIPEVCRCFNLYESPVEVCINDEGKSLDGPFLAVEMVGVFKDKYREPAPCYDVDPF
jgi:hypothetical protein